MSPRVHRILIAGCALVAGLHGPRSVSLLMGVEPEPHSVRAAEVQLREAGDVALTRPNFFPRHASGGPFTALLGMLAAAPGS